MRPEMGVLPHNEPITEDTLLMVGTNSPTFWMNIA